jgi:hypothetical protein
MSKINAYEYAPVHETIDLGSLEAANAQTDSLDLRKMDKSDMYKNILFQLVIAGITTNVVLRFLGSLDGGNWFNLDEAGDTTYSANGTYSKVYNGSGEIRYIAVLFVSESGGTAATIGIKVKVY